LEFENGQCRLAADAQKTMTNMQLEATRVSLQAAMAEEA
jgi:hypothetical protein